MVHAANIRRPCADNLRHGRAPARPSIARQAQSVRDVRLDGRHQGPAMTVRMTACAPHPATVIPCSRRADGAGGGGTGPRHASARRSLSAKSAAQPRAPPTRRTFAGRRPGFRPRTCALRRVIARRSTRPTRFAAPAGALQAPACWAIRAPECGCSSGVEHHVANVRVVGSNPIARSNPSKVSGPGPSEPVGRPGNCSQEPTIPLLQSRRFAWRKNYVQYF